jgi:hypothetical protein
MVVDAFSDICIYSELEYRESNNIYCTNFRNES